MGTAMDNTAFHELIEQVRGTAAELAQAEQKVAGLNWPSKSTEPHSMPAPLC